ncbi:MAG: hypothetical protein R3330_04180 [Saprospiraceae bacterium]|nr:hypothetical protein [Saprospiraceae bacterium]
MFQESPFSGFCATSTLEVLLMLVGTLLLGILLGYLIWGWIKGRVSELEREVSEQGRIAQLKDNQIADLQTRILTLEQRNEQAQEALRSRDAQYNEAIEKIKGLSDRVEKAEPDAHTSTGAPVAPVTQTPSLKPSDADPPPVKKKKEISPPVAKESKAAPKSQPLRKGSTKASLAIAAEVLGSKVSANDLKIVEGIGPKIEEILRGKGIKTWAKLAQARLPELRKILEDAGPRYRLANPKTWPRQARMAAKGEWKKLKAYQETLKGGREN